jgi:hypothetical protein
MPDPRVHAQSVQMTRQVDAFRARVIVFLGVEFLCAMGSRHDVHDVIVAIIA